MVGCKKVKDRKSLSTTNELQETEFFNEHSNY